MPEPGPVPPGPPPHSSRPEMQPLKETAPNASPPRRALCSRGLEKAFGQKRYKPGLQLNNSPSGRRPPRHAASRQPAVLTDLPPPLRDPQQQQIDAPVPPHQLRKAGDYYSVRHSSAFLLQFLLISVEAKPKMFKGPPHTKPCARPSCGPGGQLEQGRGGEVSGPGRSQRKGSLRSRGAAVHEPPGPALSPGLHPPPSPHPGGAVIPIPRNTCGPHNEDNNPFLPHRGRCE